MHDPRTMLVDVDYSGLHSEPGSREWIITRRSLLLSCLSDIKNNRATGQAVYEEIKRTGGWEHLTDLKGRPFQSFAHFCRSPNGLGLDRTEIERRLTAQEMAQSDEVPPAMTHAEAGAKGGRGNKATRNTRSFRHDSTEGIVARLKRDAPEFAERLADGEFKSARAAALAAGIIKEPTPKQQVKRLLPKLSRAELLALRKAIDARLGEDAT